MRMLRFPPVNRVVRFMIASDFLIVSSTGFLSPIGAVFFTQQIVGGTLAAVGFATTVFWLAKSAAQFPVSFIADDNPGERDDFAIMLVGIVINAAVQFGYCFLAHAMWQVYLLSVVDGIGYAMQVPTFLAIFTRHIDRHQESTEWMLHSNAVGLGFGMTAAIGGLVAERWGFRVIFFISGLMLLAGAAALVPLRDRLFVTDGDGRSELLAERTRPKP